MRSLGFLRRIVEVPWQDLNGVCWKAELYHGAARHFCPRGEANTTRAQLNLSLLRSPRTQYDGFGILLTVEVDTFEPPIHGPTCERLKSGAAVKVQIIYGCGTTIIP